MASLEEMNVRKSKVKRGFQYFSEIAEIFPFWYENECKVKE